MDAIFYHDGRWLTENPRLLGPMDQAFWLSAIVFDGARAFNGCAPDLDRHCERAVASAERMLLKPTHTAAEIMALSQEAVRRFPRDAELYIRPMFYARGGFLVPDPASTEFVLAVYRAPLPPATGIGVCLASQRRPAPDQAPTDAKASCLYPNTSRALLAARNRGFDNAVVLDPDGNVAELASSNLWLVKDGKAITPRANGTFLAGVTRKRVMQLLNDDGIEAVEATVTFDDVMQADELFSTGNMGKVLPIVRVEERNLQAGAVARRARELYWSFAETQRVF